MSNEITIEKIDAVIQRVPSATYAEAKQALIEHNGDVIESIIALESNKTTIESNLSKKTKQAKKAVEDMFSKDSEDFKEMKEQAKELLKRSSVIRVIIDRNNKAWGSIIGKVIITRCSNCGKIHRNKIYTEIGHER